MLNSTSTSSLSRAEFPPRPRVVVDRRETFNIVLSGIRYLELANREQEQRQKQRRLRSGTQRYFLFGGV